VAPSAEHQVLADRERGSLRGARGAGGTIVGVHAYRAKVEAKARIEVIARAGVQRLAGGGQGAVNRGGRHRAIWHARSWCPVDPVD
jgi:hypothetical protein